MTIKTRQELEKQVASGKRVRFLFFWGHTRSKNGVLGSECLSQWYSAGFEVDRVRYPTAEHFMMAEKARLFGDTDNLAKIIEAKSPGAAKALGRRVRGFQQEEWGMARFEIVVRGTTAKFSQNHDLGVFLSDTRNRVLVEASPRDRIWGIGLSASNEKAKNPFCWRGENLLGFALMAAREALAEKTRTT